MIAPCGAPLEKRHIGLIYGTRPHFKGHFVNKPVLGVYQSPKGHWVGDGFPVRSLFSYDQMGRHTSPFLLLDYAGPTQFAPASQPRGVVRAMCSG